MASNQYISPFVSNGDTFRSADKTSYDLTNPSPVGGPINSPQYNYSHTYTPTNKYLNNFESEASNNSAFGIEGNEILNNNIFKKTNLDIEDPEPGDLGGPNRTNIPNIPTGEYTNLKSGNIYGQSPYPGGTLRNQDGTPNKVMIQRWNEDNTYLDSMKPNRRIINSNQPQSKIPSNLNAQDSKELNTAITTAQGGISLGNLPGGLGNANQLP
jgi:hypothetical protein